MSETRIPTTEIAGFSGAMAKRFTRRMLGDVPEQLGVMWHNKSVLMTMMGLSRKAKKWTECDEQLKAFAHMAVVSLVGCEFCLDLGYFMAHHDGLDVEKAREVPRRHESSVFTPVERDVMRYAEAMSQTPPTVTDDVVARLLTTLGAPAVLELTAFVALANMAARMNMAIGPFPSQGFSTACGLRPLAEPASATTVVSLVR